ncbi:hypothetical protein [Marinibacterium sp. SX1]|uniref:hypothetical protein n=1 Tax=Marinibacterium sp. SX1 TaxID=3388424 RepID=UPI003D18603A
MNIIDTITAAAAPMLLEIVASIVTALVGWAVLEIKRRTGLEIEEKHRAALEAAIMSGIRALIDRDESTTALDAVEAYVRESVPDAIRALKPTDAVLRQKITGALRSQFAF